MCYDGDMMDKTLKNDISPRREAGLAAALLILGFLARLLFIGSLPYGLNQDEASAGYDAWALLTWGLDRCGNSLPVLLEAWGSGQNALYSYLSMPFIALLGLSPLSVRLVNAISGCCALIIMWRLARRLRGPRFGLAALLLLAVNPWHIMASRWALESNLLPTFLLAGVYFTVLSRERDRCLIPASLFFGLSLYAYGTAYFFLPAFLIFAVVWLRRGLRARSFLPALALFVLIALPISLCQLRNALGLPEYSLFGLTLPALTETRQSAASVFGGGGSLGANLLSALRILVTQSDGLSFNSLGLKGAGMFYIFGLPLALIGLVCGLKTAADAPGEAPVLAALLCALAASPFIDGNINRLNMLWLPLIYFMALGLHVLLAGLGNWAALPLAGILVSAALFASAYCQSLGGEGSSHYFPGLGEAIEYVEAQKPESAFISYHVSQPYIFALFYTQTPPEEFIDTVDYQNPQGAFRWVRSFGRWRFGAAEEAGGEYLILHVSETGERRVLQTFGQYAVCAG